MRVVYQKDSDRFFGLTREGKMKPMDTKTDFSSGGLVWDRASGRVLIILVQNLSGSLVWTFPKGHPEEGEPDDIAALREVQEETGWMCCIERSLMDVNYTYAHDNATINKSVRWFLMKPIKKIGEFDPEEVKECKWVTLQQAGELVSYGSDKELLKQVTLLL